MSILYKALILLLILINSAAAENSYLLSNVKVIDGDTLRADINLGFDIILNNQKIRCSDYDAWESKKGRRGIVYHKDEISMGKSAKKFLESLTKDPFYLTPSNKRDSFGRILGKISILSEDKALSLKELMSEKEFIRK